MKFYRMLTATLMVSLVLFGCSKKESSQPSQYADAQTILQTVVDAYSEEERFSIAGGDSEHAVMDAPGSFDINKKEELKSMLNFPEALIPDVESAASMVHMMNANTFTAAAYRLKADTDLNAFAQEWTDSVSKTQWLCGTPDTLLVISVGDHDVIAAYGADDIIQIFKTHALETLTDAKVISEAPAVSS